MLEHSNALEHRVEIVADLVGERDALRYGALVMSSAHGIAALELSGHLAEEKWKVSGEELVQSLVDAIQSDESRRRVDSKAQSAHTQSVRHIVL